MFLLRSLAGDDDFEAKKIRRGLAGNRAPATSFLKHGSKWTGPFRGSPVKWDPTDGQAVVDAVLKAKENPVKRPVDPTKLHSRPKPLKARIESVTVPDAVEEPDASVEVAGEPTAHIEIQWLLLKLGNDMGLDVCSKWVNGCFVFVKG